MKSKRYCPSCGSFDIRRIKRTFLQKKIFRLSPKYHCIQCHEVTHRKHLEQNKLVFQPSLNEILLENTAHSNNQLDKNQRHSQPVNNTNSNKSNTNNAAIEEVSYKDCA